MSEDDDIPVLTQILRTGDLRSGRIASSSTVPLIVQPSERAPMGDALVIGNEAHESAVEAPAAPFDDDDEGHDPARYAVSDSKPDERADERADARIADSFRLPQDHDQAAAGDARGARFDEPEIGGAVERLTMVEFAGPIAPEPNRERRVNPFVPDEPRNRRQDAGEVSLQRLASITSSVRDSVLVALQTRIDTELDARIAQAMHREVETAIAHLQDKLRDGLTEALRDVVARAVDDEMSRFVAAERDAAARLDPRKPPVRIDV